MLKILHIINSVNPEGGGPIEGIVSQSSTTTLADTTREILSLDHPDDRWVRDCALTVHATGSYKSESRTRLQSPLPWVRYGVSREFVTWLKQNASRFDVIVVNGLWNFTTLGAAIALGRTAVPYVVYTHGMLDPWFKTTYPIKHFFKQLVWLFADGRVLNRADAVMFTSEDEMVLARGAFWPYRAKERVIAYGAADAPANSDRQRSAFKSKCPSLGDRAYLLFLSRIHEKKGCDLLVSAFSRIAAANPDLDLVIAGPDQVGLTAKLKALGDAAGVADRIHWTGMLTGDAKWGAFRGASAFVLPSHQENFGIVVAEAMACGTPVLISNKVNIWREVQGSGAGLVASDTQAGTDELLTTFLGMSKAAVDAMRLAARRGYELRFSAANAAESTMTLFRDLARADHGLTPGGGN